LFYSRPKVTLMDSLCGIGDGLGCRSYGGLDHSILDVSAAYFTAVREGV
jgi:hypothetical protein